MKISKLKLYRRNKEWLLSEASVRHKLSYYFSLVATFIMQIFNRKAVHYLGNNFNYDSPTTPLSLQYYPYEISNKILANLKNTDLTHVLDIGGNIGQFSITLSALSPKTSIDVFEPNPFSFAYLKDNVKNKSKIKTFNLGIGKKSKQTLYYSKSHSDTGSIIKENAGDDVKESAEVKIISNIENVTGRLVYDLVKIDVEGYEYELLKHIENVSFSYLFIEITGLAKQKNYSHSELFNLLSKKFGSFEILHSSSSSVNSTRFDMLIYFSGKSKPSSSA